MQNTLRENISDCIYCPKIIKIIVKLGAFNYGWEGGDEDYKGRN